MFHCHNGMYCFNRFKDWCMALEANLFVCICGQIWPFYWVLTNSWNIQFDDRKYIMLTSLWCTVTPIGIGIRTADPFPKVDKNLFLGKITGNTWVIFLVIHIRKMAWLPFPSPQKICSPQRSISCKPKAYPITNIFPKKVCRRIYVWS